MFSFITQHNTTDVASFEEHAIGMLTAGLSTRAVARELNVHFSTISRLQRRFREFGSTFNRLHNRRPRVTTTAQDLHIHHLHLQDRLRPATQTALVCITKEFLHKLSETAWGVFFTDESRFSLYKADGRQRVWHRVGERFAVNIVDQVGHSGGGIMVWAGICYGQRAQVYFIDGILNAQRYRNEILRPIVVPFIHDHHLMLQHDNARPHVARICTQFLEAENIPVLACPAHSPDMSPIEHIWDALDRRIRQRVPVPANIQQLCTAIEEEWTNIPQATINNLINSMRRRCVALREANGGHTRYWLVIRTPQTPSPNTLKLHILEWPFIVASLRHTCAIIMLSNQHLDMQHLWGGWIISAKEKCSLTQI